MHYDHANLLTPATHQQFQSAVIYILMRPDSWLIHRDAPRSRQCCVMRRGVKQGCQHCFFFCQHVISETSAETGQGCKIHLNQQVAQPINFFFLSNRQKNLISKVTAFLDKISSIVILMAFIIVNLACLLKLFKEDHVQFGWFQQTEIELNST